MRSVSTFRSRTDSSSIGDYESHSSDYEDEEFDDPFTEDNLFSEAGLMAEEDAFDIDIDANTFDLATFIIEDDIPVVQTSLLKNKIVIPQKDLKNEKHYESDVDIETLEDATPIEVKSIIPEPDIEEEDEPVVVNNKKKVEKEEKLVAKKNVNLVPNKRQRDFLKGKFGVSRGKGLGKGKSISMHKKPPTSPLKKSPVVVAEKKDSKTVAEKKIPLEIENANRKLNFDEYKKRRDCPVPIQKTE